MTPAPITIPPAALEAFLREVETHDENISGEAARAACLAMLAAWPGVWDSWSVFEGERQIILPLPQETSDD